MPRILVVYYSRTGHTRQIAELIAGRLAADVEEIRDPTQRTGVWGYLRSGRQAFFRRHAPIAPAVHDPARYDLVVIGTPIWNASLSVPVRSYIAAHRAAMRTVAFFCTCGGMGMERVFQQMTEACGRQPQAKLTVFERDLASPTLPAEIDRFVAAIKPVANAAAPAMARPA